jgi:hypothetical protein
MPENDECIAIDLATGDELVLLSDLRNETYVPHPKGRKLDKSAIYRWAQGRRGRKLETIKTPTGAATTKAAVLRFFASMSSNSPAQDQQRTPLRRAREVAAAQRELEAAGI